ncbi:CBS domain-containing protein [Desulfoplanes formicivorans]|uniref:Acetoin utilization protein n=1 Tax=Desulfoplanes formicivorans TaxID=1592317 RepID=A0A194AFT1_9BACT|nr:CBS domain-containing protein [Desulfoplanes formicivorans]GAU08188.1 acetoin utilization protein [Desulfoplanes formicivorans]
MFVGLKMLKDTPTIGPETLVVEADRIMEENRLWMLMVLTNGKLTGYVTREDVRAALPSPATTLSRHELNYLLDELTVKDVVKGNPPCVSPEMEIERAAQIMHEQNLAGLAVVDANQRFLGYISRSVMLDVLVEEMGLNQSGSRICIEVEDKSGVMASVTRLLADMGVNIIATATFYHATARMLVFRIGVEEPEKVVSALKQEGYRVLGPKDVAREWGCC